MTKTCLYIFAFLATLLNAVVCLAQDQESSSIGATDDCTKILLNFKNVPNLTRQEKISHMDKALRDSLNQYERCQNAHSRSSSTSGGGGGGKDGTAGKSQQTSSTASSGMSGTNIPVAGKSSASNQSGVRDVPVNKGVPGRTKGTKVLGNGKIPDDIPSVDNDSALEEQIRQAAMNETDPVIKRKLWNEYRKYKGLPVVHK